jgi:multidrug transporter EmrE-like cation transporter
MSTALIALFALSIACDVAGQTCFKLGASALPHERLASPRFFARLLRNGWLMAGLAICGFEMFVWLRILSQVPLNLAYSIASVNVLGITLASWLILKETVGPRRWVGAGLVTAGIVLATVNP